MTRPITVLLPAPLGPTRAVVVPAGASKLTPFKTGRPSRYEKVTSSKTTSPSSRATGERLASSRSSVGSASTSRMRSRPANASVICVPMALIWMSGVTIKPVNTRNMKMSPTVIRPASTSRAPATLIAMPTSPKSRLEKPVIIDTPFIDLTTLRSTLWAPCAKIRSSRFSAV